jgi:hypothetical protein
VPLRGDRHGGGGGLSVTRLPHMRLPHWAIQSLLRRR